MRISTRQLMRSGIMGRKGMVLRRRWRIAVRSGRWVVVRIGTTVKLIRVGSGWWRENIIVVGRMTMTRLGMVIPGIRHLVVRIVRGSWIEMVIVMVVLERLGRALMVMMLLLLMVMLIILLVSLEVIREARIASLTVTRQLMLLLMGVRNGEVVRAARCASAARTR